MKTFFCWKKFEISHFQAVHCVRENAISPKAFTRFSKTFLLLKDVENRYLAQNFIGAAILVWQGKGKTITKGKFEISQFQAAHCARKSAISPKVFNRFSKTFLPLEDMYNRYLSRKFHGRSYFSFAMVRWKLFSGRKIRNFPLSSCTLCQRKCYITKGIHPDFQILSFCWKMWKIGIWAKISWAQLF